MKRNPPNCDSQGASIACDSKFYCFCTRCEAGTQILLERLTGIDFRSTLHGRHCWITLKHTWSDQNSLEALPIRELDSVFDESAFLGSHRQPEVEWDFLPFLFLRY